MAYDKIEFHIPDELWSDELDAITNQCDDCINPMAEEYVAYGATEKMVEDLIENGIAVYHNGELL